MKYTSSDGKTQRLSRAPHGARGLKFDNHIGCDWLEGRAPHGARGLKYHCRIYDNNTFVSRPARGAWIEITRSASPRWRRSCRAPHGARGLKYKVHSDRFSAQRQSRPARGAWIEIPRRPASHPRSGSRPARGAWIEICSPGRTTSLPASRPARGAWIEIAASRSASGVGESRPARGAWIEIFTLPENLTDALVAPRTGRVD